MASLKLVCLALVVGLVAVAPLASSSVNCPQVQSYVAPCLVYLRLGGTIPQGCCSGIRSLNGAAKTTPDRQAACRCLQAAAGNMRGLKPGLVSALPGKCGINIPYKISPATDCSRVR
ncbi:non-specific lipid-transfer protein 1-like [Rhodamnia argentea]|uniref:Non-specific lipid-transfer protein n=1 Tax=Rhodamnia argentea TaxID=178133 RepID=A0A8B8Q461_9MYRT|nr:non-specific lipid-transfer protein 1-like [Rhodamnia argentea]